MKKLKTRMKTSIEAQIKNLKSPSTDTSHIFTPTTIRNGFFIKFYLANLLKNLQIDPQTTEKWSKKLNKTLLVNL